MIVKGWAAEEDSNLRKTWREVLLGTAGQLTPPEAARLLNHALAQEEDANARRQLAVLLAAVAGQLETAEATRVCADAAQLLDQALAQEGIDVYCVWLATGLAAVAARLEPIEAARLLARAGARVKGDVGFDPMTGERKTVRNELVRGLKAVARNLNPAERVRLLNQALAREKDARARDLLVKGLTAVAERSQPAQAGRAVVAGRLDSDEDARLLTQALAQEKGVSARLELAARLAAVAGRMKPAEAARLLEHALAQVKGEDAFILTNGNKYGSARHELILGLAAVAGRLDPAEAARVCVKVARTEIQTLDQQAPAPEQRAAIERVSMLMRPLDSEGLRHAARVLARRIVSDPDFCYSVKWNFDSGVEHETRVFHPEVLEGILISAPRPHVHGLVVAIAMAIGISANCPALNLPLLHSIVIPPPCRLSTQDLVDLLKMPTCVREVRRVILDQLGNRYRRRFDTHWDFVRYAQQ